MSDAAARPDGSASAAGHVYSAFTILGDLPGDDDGNEMAVLQTWETPVIQFHVRPRTTRRLQDVDPPMSRPQTPSFWSGAVRQRGTATDASMQNAYLKDTLGVYDPANFAETRRRIEEQKRVFQSIQHAAAAEAATLTQILSEFDGGVWSNKTLADIPGFVPDLTALAAETGKVRLHELEKRTGPQPEERPARPNCSSLVSTSTHNKPMAHQKSTRVKRRLSLSEEAFKAKKAARASKEKDEMRLQALGKSLVKPPWWRDRNKVESRAVTTMGFAVLFGLTGSVMAIFQNELVYKEYDPRGVEMDMLKAFNSILTLACLVCIYLNYHLKIYVFRLNRHCRTLTPLDRAPVLPDVLLRQPVFWLEILFCGCHCPPFYTSEVSTETYENLVVYRIETLAALINMLRIYLLWKYLRDLTLNSIPKRHMITRFTGAEFRSIYVLKGLLRGRHGLVMIGTLWLVLIWIAAYAFRAGEITACALNTTITEKCLQGGAQEWVLYGSSLDIHSQFYIWDSIWFMCITTLTVGYGDMAPTTHYGRVCAAAIAAVGILLGSVMTASMAHLLEWDQAELSTLRILERERARNELKAIAHDRLALQFRFFADKKRKSRHRLNWAQHIRTHVGEFLKAPMQYMCNYRITEKSELTVKIRKLQRMLNEEVTVMGSDRAKIGRLLSDIKSADAALKQVCLQFENVEVMESFAKRLRQASVETGNHHQERAKQHIATDTSEEEGSRAKVPAGLGHVKRMGTIKDFASNQNRMDEEEAKLEPSKAWWRDKDQIHCIYERYRLYAAIVVSVGTMSALMQNEAVINGTASQTQLNLLKALNSVCTMICLLMIIRIYWLNILLSRVLEHVTHLNTLISGHVMTEIFTDPVLWLELGIVGVHCPPFFEYSYGTTIQGNYQVYEIETVFGCLNLLRLYLVWRVVVDWMLADLPKRHTLAGFNNCKLGSRFVFKRMMHSASTSTYFVVALWISAIMWFAYWYRSAELTACLFPEIEGRVRDEGCSLRNSQIWNHYGYEFDKVNDYHFQNACWHMFVTATSVGYGEVLVTTHFGRAIAICAGWLGMMLVALTTASLSNLLEWSSIEETANEFIRREILHDTRKLLAVGMIQRWWRVKLLELKVDQDRNVAKSRAAAKMNMLANKSYKKSFISSVLDPYKNAKDAILLERMRRELDDDDPERWRGFSHKVDLVSQKFGRMQDDLNWVYSRLVLDKETSTHGEGTQSSDQRNTMSNDMESIVSRITAQSIANLSSPPFPNVNQHQ